MVRVVDVTPYNGESIMEKRLRYLDPHVALFVVVEARYTYSGLKKEQLYIDITQGLFKPYKHKIKFVVIDEFPPMDAAWAASCSHWPWIKSNQQHWWREWVQREAPLPYLRDLAHETDFLALVCDNDEIPSQHTIELLLQSFELLHSRPAIHLDMSFHYYSFEWTKPERWCKAFAITGKRLEETEPLTAIRWGQPVSIVSDAGWHCSYFMTDTDIARKIQSFSHRECDAPQHTDTHNIRRCLETGKDLFGRSVEDPFPTPTHVLRSIPDELF